MEFSPSDYWKAIILYGLNVATYKMALARCLLSFAQSGVNVIQWEQLATCFYDEYRSRLQTRPMPQQQNPGRLTVLERIVKEEAVGRITRPEAIEKVAREGFNDVVPRFQTIGTNKNIARNLFYEIEFGKNYSSKITYFFWERLHLMS